MKKHSNLFILLLILAILGSISLGAQERIVIGGRSSMMLADAVYLFPGAGTRIVAYARGDQGLGNFITAIDPNFKNYVSFDRNAGAEEYASFKPDLVILKSAMMGQLKAPLDALGIRQLYLTLETPEQYYEDIGVLGKVLGDEKRGAEVVSWFASHEAKIVARTSKLGANQKPRVLVARISASGEAAWQVPPDSWIQTTMVERAGGLAVWKDANPGSGWATVTLEQIAAWNPDYVFIVDYRENSAKGAEAFRKDGRFASLKAVKSNAVFGFPQDFYSWDQPDTRWILGFTWLATRIHPELFADISVAQTTRDFFNFMYGLDESAFRSLILPKIQGDLGEQF